MGAAIGKKLIAEAEGEARMFHSLRIGVVESVAVAFVVFVVIESFGVGEPDA